MIETAIRINNNHIAEIKAKKDGPYVDADTFHTYNYEVRQYQVPADPIEARNKMRDPGDPIVKSGVVTHRYKDGAVTLLLKILQDAETTV